jgi:signal transduction histidine kinase
MSSLRASPVRGECDAGVPRTWPHTASVMENPLLEPAVEKQAPTGALPLTQFANLLDAFDRPLLIAERSGKALFANSRAQNLLQLRKWPAALETNLFLHVLQVDAQAIMGQLESGEREIDLPLKTENGHNARARIRWLPEPDWLVVSIDEAPELPLSDDPNVRNTLQELLQEREITYRNLLAAYLRLQEVNRQKTVFLASAAHELKTPLAVMKGYYDLLLSGSLGKLSERQREIVQESKESCDRLVRLVSMFLNYSALESGKLVLHLRDNDLRDCLSELVARWSDAFLRRQVRLETKFHPALRPFKFDYQKVQQCVANLLDNALKHTPPGGVVTLQAEPHFWERRANFVAAGEERRRGDQLRPNSALISVSDTGPGIAVEFHQEIFEEFVRVDRSSSGMGLGLAIVKRLVQAHRGKIWVESEPGRGSTFSLLLPTDTE